MSRVILSGYFGFNNAGDEAILYAMIRALKGEDPSMEIVVLSHQPQKTARDYGVQAVNRWRLWAVLRAMLSCDLVISGGGSLLQDVSSANSPLYYLGIIFLAKLCGKPVMVYAQGIGPLNRTLNRKLTAWLFNRVQKVTVRDRESAEELATLGVGAEIIVTADPVLGLAGEGIDCEPGRQILLRNGVALESGKRLGVFIRPWQDNLYLDELAQACDQLAADGWVIIFVPMHFPEDIKIARKAAGLMKREAILLKEHYSPPEQLSLAKNMDVVVGMRLHALINSAVAGTPCIGLSYDPKVERFLAQLGQQSLTPVHDLSARALAESVRWAATKRAEILSELAPLRLELYGKARKTAEIAFNLLAQASTERG